MQCSQLVSYLRHVVCHVSTDAAVTLWATSDAVAMVRMTGPRVAWMGAVARGVARRRALATARVATTHQKRRRRQPSA